MTEHVEDAPTIKPRISPAWLAGGLVLVALLGASFIYYAGSRGLERDRRDIIEYSEGMEPAFQKMREASVQLFGAVTQDRETVIVVASGYASFAHEGLPNLKTPDIVEPLAVHYETAMSGLQGIVSGAQNLSMAELSSMVTLLQQALNSAEAELAEMRCNARITCD